MQYVIDTANSIRSGAIEAIGLDITEVAQSIEASIPRGVMSTTGIPKETLNKYIDAASYIHQIVMAAYRKNNPSPKRSAEELISDLWN